MKTLKRGADILKEIALKYGSGKIKFQYPEEDIINTIEPNHVDLTGTSGAEIVKKSLENPIGTKRLSELVKPGEKVCVIIPDITRAWQSTSVYIPPVIDEISKAGVKDEDIILISATGSHREQTKEEHITLVGEDVYNRIKIYDHDCHDKENLVYLGESSYGTPIFLNKMAMECDHIVLTGGAILHFMGGYGGGRKYVVPGIAGYKTIMHNHSYALNEGFGSGSNPEVKATNMTHTNKLHMDLTEIAAKAKPLFMMNVVVDSEKRITHAFSGDYLLAHEKACEMVKYLDCVEIEEKADLVIGSGCGFPKDINLYQINKPITNVLEAVKPDGVMIIAAECCEFFGSEDTENIIVKYDNMMDRERDLRDNFSIGKFAGYRPVEIAEQVHMILVSSFTPEMLKNTKIICASTMDEAIEKAKSILGKEHPSTIIMPYAANTLPLMK